MWLLEGGIGDRPQQDILLLPGSFVVGRLGTDIELDDKSVSRRHAKLTVSTATHNTLLKVEGQGWAFPTKFC